MNTKSMLLYAVIIIALAAGVFLLVRSVRPNNDPDKLNGDIADTNGEVAGSGTGGCFVGGCSQQVCSEDKDVVTTCEYKEEYACYKAAKCERQLSGQCGWTETPEFNICLNAILYPDSDLK